MIYLFFCNIIFWLNFSLNFKDESFVNLIESDIDKQKCSFIKKKLKDIILIVYQFLKQNLSTQGKLIIIYFFNI